MYSLSAEIFSAPFGSIFSKIDMASPSNVLADILTLLKKFYRYLALGNYTIIIPFSQLNCFMNANYTDKTIRTDKNFMGDNAMKCILQNNCPSGLPVRYFISHLIHHIYQHLFLWIGPLFHLAQRLLPY